MANITNLRTQGDISIPEFKCNHKVVSILGDIKVVVPTGYDFLGAQVINGEIFLAYSVPRGSKDAYEEYRKMPEKIETNIGTFIKYNAAIVWGYSQCPCCGKTDRYVKGYNALYSLSK